MVVAVLDTEVDIADSGDTVDSGIGFADMVDSADIDFVETGSVGTDFVEPDADSVDLVADKDDRVVADIVAQAVADRLGPVDIVLAAGFAYMELDSVDFACKKRDVSFWWP